MRSRSEREIARRLSERGDPGDVEPPADLLARLQAEIPAEIPLEIQVSGKLASDRRTPRQGWLIAASLVAMIGAGLFSLHVRETGREVVSLKAETAKDQVAPPPERRPAESPMAQKPPMAWKLPMPPPAAASPSRSPMPPAAVQQPRQEAAAAPPVAAIPGGVVGGAVAEPASPAPALPPLVSAEAERKEELGVETANESAGATEGAAPAASAASAAPAASAARAEPRAKAMTLEKRARPVQPPGTFLDAAAVPRDVVGSRTETSPAKPAAAEAQRSSAQDRMAPSPAPPPAEGAPSLLAAGDHRWLLLFRRAQASGTEVEFNPAVVALYRRVSVAGAVLLYEIELRPAAGAAAGSIAGLAAGSATVATLRGGSPLRVSDLAPSWELASPGFRLSSLEAKLLELEGMPPAVRPRGDRAAVLGRARALAEELPGDRHAAEVLGRAERLSH
jgi:hypothetical protein